MDDTIKRIYDEVYKALDLEEYELAVKLAREAGWIE